MRGLANGMTKGIGQAPFLAPVIDALNNDGRPLQVDLSQPGQVGLATRSYDFGAQNLGTLGSLVVGAPPVTAVAGNGILINRSGYADSIGLSIVSSPGQANATGSYKGINLAGDNWLTAAGGASAFGVYAQPTFEVQGSITSGNGIQGLRFAPTIHEQGAGGYTVNHVDCVYAQMAGGVTTTTELNMFKGVVIGTGTTVTTMYGFQFDGGTGASGGVTTQVGLKIKNLGGFTNWGFQIDGSAVNSYIAGALTIGAAAAPIASAVLDLSQTTTGALVVPKMTTTQKNALTAADGMIVFDTTLAQFQVRQGAAWIRMSAA